MAHHLNEHHKPERSKDTYRRAPLSVLPLQQELCTMRLPDIPPPHALRLSWSWQQLRLIRSTKIASRTAAIPVP
ncbi:hypothetical protein V5799_030433 [Amblyomma americanum]|uniref:Uncharacterized protein n=1 Tax=Amblyomma americanum TaxID=6943 RepID=A0AAQ4ENS4_AMBAM